MSGNSAHVYLRLRLCSMGRSVQIFSNRGQIVSGNSAHVYLRLRLCSIGRSVQIFANGGQVTPLTFVRDHAFALCTNFCLQRSDRVRKFYSHLSETKPYQVLWISDILVRIRVRIQILGSVPLTNGSVCGYGRPKNLRIRIHNIVFLYGRSVPI